MELNEIKKILKKYNSGISNLEEECLLKEFFKKNDVPEDLIHYKLIFNYLDYANDYNFNKKVKISYKIVCNHFLGIIQSTY